jgi:AAA+ superfamily predicted ATPase
MASAEMTKHFIMDLKTGFTYGIKLDAEGNCKAVQSLKPSIETDDGRVIQKFGPLHSLSATQAPLPYGQTTVAVELTADGSKGRMFTIVWPTQEEVTAGTLPRIASKSLPDDLVKAGLAPRPKADANAPGQDEEAVKKALENIDKMIGLDTAKHEIKQNIALARFSRMKQELGIDNKVISRHMVFTGNPGTGKTTFAREVAKVYHALGFIKKPQVHEVTREDLVAGFVGQTALKTKEAIDKAKGGILFIDEAYALSREAGASDSKDFGREAIDTLVAAMENMRDDLIVIVAGYPEPMKKFIDANPGLKSRFLTYINFEDYGLNSLGNIMDVMLQERGYTMTQEAREAAMRVLEDERQRTKKDFGNGRTVRNLVEKAEKEMALRLEAEHKLDQNHGLSEKDIKKALTTITLADIQSVSLDGIGNTPGAGGMGFRIGDAANDAFAPPPRVVEPVRPARRLRPGT